MLLEVKDLCVSYGAIRALESVCFSVSSGEIVAIIGANGAGKTTALCAISGLLKVASGDIVFKGVSLKGLQPHKIVKSGVVQVPEGRGIFSPLTVLENLEIAAASGAVKAKAADFDHVFGLFPRLRERKRQMAGTLSGGEQQMLAVGRALLAKGELLLLDEPSMGLAPALVESIFQIIVRINREGTTVLLVEQNAHKALSIANKAYVLENGSVVLSGPAADLKNNPRVKEAYLGG